MAHATAHFLVPGPWGVAKMSNNIKFQLLSQFHIILNQTLHVLSQIKDIKRIRRDFIQSHGVGLWRYCGVGGSKTSTKFSV